MKVASTQIFNAAIQLMSGAMADSRGSLADFDDSKIQMYIDIVQRTADLIPEHNDMPDDDEIREAVSLAMNDGEMGAALLGNTLGMRFGMNQYQGYVIIQRAVQLGIIKGRQVGKNKTVYSLA